LKLELKSSLTADKPPANEYHVLTAIPALPVEIYNILFSLFHVPREVTSLKNVLIPDSRGTGDGGGEVLDEETVDRV